MIVILISLLHGLPVYILGVTKQSKAWMIWAFIISISLGAMIGNPKYFGYDLVAASIGLYLGWIENNRQYGKKETASQPMQIPHFIKELFDYGVIIIVGLMIYFGYIKYQSHKLDNPELSKPETYSQPQIQPTSPPPQKITNATKQDKAKPKSNRIKPKQMTPQERQELEAYCLTLQTDAEKIVCLDR